MRSQFTSQNWVIIVKPKALPKTKIHVFYCTTDVPHGWKVLAWNYSSVSTWSL